MPTAVLMLAAVLPSQAADAPSKPPNVVLIFTDDQGYGDLGCFGARGYATPNIDRLAEQGRRFTDFYVATAVCSASRAALLTGCYPKRVGIYGALGPKAREGLNPDEQTLGDLFAGAGYATACVGKWHLGHRSPCLPTDQGFGEWYGLPYSNDMWPYHPENPTNWPKLPLMAGTAADGVSVVDAEVTPAEQRRLTTDYTAKAIDFIRRGKDRPFFLYLAHSMPHVPLFVSGKYRDTTRQGRYGDVIAEIDWSVGEVMRTLDELGLADDTLVVFTSDNGPWLSYGDHAGSAGPLREGKGTIWEGGVRVPCVMRWPGRIPAGSVCKEPLMTIDLLPTLAGLLGTTPAHEIDGLDALATITGDASGPHEALYFWWGAELQAVRAGDWKLHFPHDYRTLAGRPGVGGIPSRYVQGRCGLELYDLAKDVGEHRNVADRRPEVVERLAGLADAMRRKLGDAGVPAKDARPTAAMTGSLR